MVKITPASRILAPKDSVAAQSISGPNYDEFQSDHEIWDLVQGKQHNILRTTMPHIDVVDRGSYLKDGSDEALAKARVNLQSLIDSSDSCEHKDTMWLYAICHPTSGHEQIGLGGLIASADIRTEDNPEGTVVRNEGIRLPKAQGRADLIKNTNSLIGAVNLAVEDRSESFANRLTEQSSARDCDIECTDEAGWKHKIWFVTNPKEIDDWQACLGKEEAAFVADGNHRSAAAGLSGCSSFMTVVFPVQKMSLSPYHRLVSMPSEWSASDFMDQLAESFEVKKHSGGAYQPEKIHDIGIYTAGQWYELRPKAGLYDSNNAAESIDADIVQKHILSAVLKVDDPKADCINFVGGNKDVHYLQSQVDHDSYALAISLAPVELGQFVDVCKQNRFMPPKSTWFDPKIRSGLAICLL